MQLKRCREQRKVRYKRPDLAHNAMLLMQRKAYWDDKPMNVYHCDDCGDYHLGHTPGTGRIVWLGIVA